jgi:hypothetical protein
MIAKSGLRGDSPARMAQKTLRVPLKRKASWKGWLNREDNHNC